MSRKLVASAFLLGLALSHSPAMAGWKDDFAVGQTYSSVLIIGELGTRKNVLLPPTNGHWVLIAFRQTSRNLRGRGAMVVNAKIGNFAFAEVIGGKAVSVIEVESSIGRLADVAFAAFTCSQSIDQVLHDSFPGNSGPEKKCLTVETDDPDSLSDLAQTGLADFSFALPKKIIQSTATIDGVTGFLGLKISSLVASETVSAEFVKAFSEWSKAYAKLLEASLSRSLEDSEEAAKLAGIPHQLADGKLGPVAKAKVYLPAGSAAGSNAKNIDHSEESEQILSTIERLKGLKDKGVLSEDEYRLKKEELLKRL